MTEEEKRKSHSASVKKYNKNKYKSMQCLVTHEEFEKIDRYCKKSGKTKRGFILEAFDKAMKPHIQPTKNTQHQDKNTIVFTDDEMRILRAISGAEHLTPNQIAKMCVACVKYAYDDNNINEALILYGYNS